MLNTLQEYSNIYNVLQIKHPVAFLKVAHESFFRDISENDREGHPVFTDILPSARQKSSRVARISFSFLWSKCKSGTKVEK